MPVTISCIIPTRNRPLLLRETLAAVLAQRLLPEEIIIVTNSRAALNLPEAVKERVKIFNLTGAEGAARSRNFGASRASGAYLAFLDDDDLWPKDYLFRVCQALSSGADLALSRLDGLKQGRILPYKNPAGCLTLAELLIHNPGVIGSNLVISKQVFNQLNGYDADLITSEDKDLVIRAIQAGAKLVALPDNPVIFRFSPDGLSSNHAKLAKGIQAFSRKHRRLMNLKQRLINKVKVAKHSYLAGQRRQFLPYYFWRLINRLIF